MSVTGVVQIHLTVSDLDASVAFYRDVLGLTHLFTVPEQSMAFLDAGGVRLYLATAEDPSVVSRPLVYYRVDDVTQAYAQATARGAPAVAAPHIVHRDGTSELWVAFVADPDGIRVALMAEVPRSGPG